MENNPAPKAQRVVDNLLKEGGGAGGLAKALKDYIDARNKSFETGEYANEDEEMDAQQAADSWLLHALGDDGNSWLNPIHDGDGNCIGASFNDKVKLTLDE